MNSKKLQNKIFDSVFNIQQKFNIPDNIMYLIVYIFHHILLYIMLISNLFIINKSYHMIVFLLTASAFVSLYYFHGCILSKIEQRFEKNNIIVNDFILDILNLKLTYNNRWSAANTIFLLTLLIQIVKVIII